MCLGTSELAEKLTTHLAVKEVLHFVKLSIMIVLEENLAPPKTQLCILCSGDLGVQAAHLLNIPYI